MRYGSVCSGIEAATCAWHPLGWKPAWFSEIAPFPSAVLAHHYPSVPNLGDMTKLHEREEFSDGSIELLVGGTPCQSFSVAGLRGGMADPRGNLALVFLQIARRARPKWVVWENVPGVLSSNEGRDFGAFLGGMAELGYGFAYRVLDAQYFGVPQRRRRVFVVGCLGDWRRAAAVLFERESLSGNPPPRRKTGKGVAPTLDALAGRSGETSFATSGGLIPDPVAFHGSQDPDVSGDVTHPLGRNYGREACLAFDTTQITSGENRANPSPGDPSHPLSASAHAPAIALKKVHGSSRNGANKNSVHGAEDEAMFTLGASEHHGVLVGAMVRRLTPRECERLQGFPDDYTLIPWKGRPATECPDGPRYQAIGNSMAVPVMAWIGRRIAAVEQEVPR